MIYDLSTEEDSARAQAYADSLNMRVGDLLKYGTKGKYMKRIDARRNDGAKFERL